MSHNAIYEKLTSTADGAVGVFAYIVYKQQKIEYCKSFGGREPTPEELAHFYAVAGLEKSLDAYRARGAVLARAFLNAGLDELIARTEESTRRGVLYQQIEKVNTDLSETDSQISCLMLSEPSWAGFGTWLVTCW